MDKLLTVAEVREKLPLKISERALRQRLRASGVAIEHSALA